MFNRIHWALPTRRTALVALAVLAVVAMVLAAPHRGTGGGSSPRHASDSRAATTSGGTPAPKLSAGSGSSMAASPEAMAVSPSSSRVAADSVGGAASPAPADSSPPISGGVSISPHIIQTGDIAIDVKRGELGDAFDRASRVATALGGYVVSSRTTDGSSHGTAALTLRVPSAKFTNAVSRLADIGRVRSRQVSGEDVSEEYVDTRSRLRHSRAVEGRLMLLLGRATTVQETLVVQDRLDQVQQQLEIDAGRLQYLDRLTELATIDVSLREQGVAPAHHHGARTWGVHHAFSQAARGFVRTVNSAVVAIGSALPWLLVLSLAGVVLWRRTRSN